jgi:hypothetical protein
MNSEEILKHLNSFPYDPKEYWVVAGAAMVLHGLREETADIDLGCSIGMADQLEAQGFLYRRSNDKRRHFRYDEHIEVFEEWLFDAVESIRGYPVISLKGLIKMKEELGREKDMRDIERIEAFLKARKTEDRSKEKMFANQRILFIGGSPCSGKSTLAEMISRDYGAYFYKVDDFLEEFTGKAAESESSICRKVLSMTPEEIWMRDPAIQCEEEFLIYDEIAPLVFEKLKQIDADFIVTEAAAYTPNVMKRLEEKEYISIIPSPDFQISHYKDRDWVRFVLEGCSDRDKAFENWMQREILFAKQVRRECEETGIPCIVNDGSETVDELYDIVRELFHLK